MLQTLRTRVLAVAVLSAALLLSATAGWQHRIAHAWGNPADPPGAAHAHSCAAFDAATLADMLPPCAPVVVRPAALPHVRPSAHPASRAEAGARLFDARGPPMSSPSPTTAMTTLHFMD